MKKNGGGFGENAHELEKNAKMLEKINTIINSREINGQAFSGTFAPRLYSSYNHCPCPGQQQAHTCRCDWLTEPEPNRLAGLALTCFAPVPSR